MEITKPVIVYHTIKVNDYDKNLCDKNCRHYFNDSCDRFESNLIIRHIVFHKKECKFGCGCVPEKISKRDSSCVYEFGIS